MIQCRTPKKTPTVDYPAIVQAIEAQQHIFWLPTEPKVEKDLHCIKTELTPAEYHGVLTTLKLFTLYEIVAGNEYWGGKFKRLFPRYEFQRLGACYSDVELNIHSPFYQRVDELLGLNTDEFYSSFTDDPILKSRMEFLDEAVGSDNAAYSVGVFSMVEGAILYSSFAFLMHFQMAGKNLLPNIHAGLTFSVKDENLHSETGAYVYRTMVKEMQDNNELTDSSLQKLEEKLYQAASQIREHEYRIIEMVFSEGSIKGITETQMKNFVDSRIDLCLENLGLDKVYKPSYNPIANWFYDMIGGDRQHDFFYTIDSSYNRNWTKSSFVWSN